MLATRAADASCAARLREPGRRPGRAGLRRRLDGVRRRRRAGRPGRRSSSRTCWSSTSTSDPCSASACSTPAAGARPSRPARGRRSAEHAPTPRRRPARRSCAAAASRVARGLRGARARHPRLRRARTASPTWCIGLSRRHRLVARRRASPPTRSAPSTCTACRCRRATRATARAPTPRRWPTNLGIDYRTIAIEAAVRAPSSTCWRRRSPAATPDLTEENLQSRIRGMLLMALSNKFGWLVLTTGNKSEMAVGYSTLYGDTAGGFAVIKDVPKTLVYELCRVPQRPGRARGDPRGGAHQAAVGRAAPRPARRPEPAALRGARPDPRGLRRGRPHRGRARSPTGFDEAVVRRITRLVDLAEYKRRQAPPGVRVTPKAFGKDRRLPITNGYRGSPTARPRPVIGLVLAAALGDEVAAGPLGPRVAADQAPEGRVVAGLRAGGPARGRSRSR